MGKILLIDNDPDDLIVLEEIIKFTFPDSVILAESIGSEGVKIAVIEDPDVILLSYFSQDLDGSEICQLLKQNERSKNIPLVALISGSEDEERKIEALEAGVEAFVVMPFDRIEFIALLRTMMKLKSAFVKSQNIDLVNNEERYRTIFENIQDVYYEASVDGIILEVSPSIEILSKGQYTRTDLIGIPIHSFYGNIEDRDTFYSLLYESGRVSDFEMSIRNKDCSIIMCTISAKICLDEAGLPEKVIGSMHDITERKQTEEKFRESQRRYQLVFDYSGTANSIFDTDCRLVMQNEKSVRFLGTEKLDSVGKSALEIFGPLNGPSVMKRMRRVIDTALMEEFETEFNLTGGNRWFHSIYQPIVDEKNQIQGVQVVSHDITAQKQIALALVESEARFRILSENSPTGIYTIINKRLQYVNRAFADIFGYTQEELVGSDPLAIIHPDDRQLVAENIGRRKEGEISFLKYEYRGLKKNGETNYILLLGGPTVIDNNFAIVGNILDLTERKQAEEHLKASQKQITEILESITDGFVAFDAQMNYTYINARGAELLNHKPDELIGKNYWTEFPEAKGTPFANNFLLALQTQTTVIFEDYYEPWDRWFENRIYPTQEGIAIYYSETTERKRAERSLNESNELNKSLLKTIPFGMDIVDEYGNILFLSENFEKQFGSETIGKKCWSIYRDDKEQCNSCPLLKGVEIDRTEIYETSGVLGGKSFQISHTGLMFQGKKAMLEIFQDITQKKEIEKRIKLLAQSLESISECVTITDLDDRIIYVNEAFLQTYQYSKKEIIGQLISVLRTPEQAYELARNILPKTLEGGWRGEILNIKKDGTLFPILLSTSVIKDENENPIAMIGVAMDITEMRRNREELVAAKDMAEENNRLKSALLSNLSHEIRTPMNAIIGFSDLMAGAEAEDKNLYAEIISNSSYQLLALIDDVILLSRLQSEIIPIGETEFYPAEMVREVHRMFDHPDLNNGLTMQVYVPSEYSKLFIRADENKVKQILTNLISNAVKYTFEGSVEFGFEIQSGLIEFYVKDTGIGIPEKEHSKIFDTFYRGEQAMSSAIRGTGLGLNIAKALVNGIGGTIGVTSSPNQGSRFYFTVPFVPVQPEMPVEIVSPKVPSGVEDLVILIAEDEPANYKFLEILLKGKVKRVDHAVNGKEAVEMASQNKYNLVFMDLNMPVMGGIEATKILKEKSPEILIIAQTAYSLPEEKQRALEAGCDDFISKPIKKETVMEVINKYACH